MSRELPAPSSQLTSATQTSIVSSSTASKNVGMLRTFLLACAASAIGKTLAAPLVLRIHDRSARSLPWEPLRRDADFKTRLRHFGQVMNIVRITKFRGHVADLKWFVPYQSLNLTLKEQYKEIIWHPRSDSVLHTLPRNAVAGGLAGATALIFLYPIEVARNMVLNDSIGSKTSSGQSRQLFNGVIDCILKTGKAEGWGTRGVYYGFAIACASTFTLRSLYFGLYDTFSSSSNDASLWKRVGVAYLSTYAGLYAAYPLDVVRRRLQWKRKEQQQHPTSTIAFIRNLYKERGWREFTKGGGSILFRYHSFAFTLVAFDYLFRYGTASVHT